METVPKHHNKYISIEMHAHEGDLHNQLSYALSVTKAYGAKTSLKFPKGYSVDIWPDSNLTDLKKIEELENSLWNQRFANEELREKIKELTK